MCCLKMYKLRDNVSVDYIYIFNFSDKLRERHYAQNHIINVKIKNDYILIHNT